MIEVLSILPLATVQDLGRDGHWFEGLGRAGAMDALAHRVANLLLGNEENAAALEIPLTPARFRFTERTAFALAGAACGARLDGRALPRVWAGGAEAGQVLDLGRMEGGARVCLALRGGIDVPEVLGSRSTQLREAFGGFHGRFLMAGDRIGQGSGTGAPQREMSLSLPPLRAPGEEAITLRALPSAEHDSFAGAARRAFWSAPYRVTPRCNRQGYRLEGAALERREEGELRSHGIVPGIVQVPGGGQPIVQLADCATMGGYPKIAAIIESDLWRIAQARPGDLLRFRKVTLAEAADAEAEQAAWFDGLRATLARLAAEPQGGGRHG
ncbi:MAG: biotin-dependent carboxyltransferase family protein [Tropicimonas sp.]|uniref:5-oxoprolinase subunit C family protein n=1 Tax=Tropicimonas sp. TaxID=2067044 RepID=UPI003A850961